MKVCAQVFFEKLKIFVKNPGNKLNYSYGKVSYDLKIEKNWFYF